MLSNIRACESNQKEKEKNTLSWGSEERKFKLNEKEKKIRKHRRDI